MIASHLWIIHSETYRPFVESRRQRAYAGHLCTRIQHRLSMSPPVPMGDLKIVAEEAAELLAEAEEKSPESGRRN